MLRFAPVIAMRVVIHAAGVKPEEAVEAQLPRIGGVFVSQMPLAHCSRGVAALLQHAGDGGTILRKKAAVHRYPHSLRPATGKQARARRSAHRRVGVPVGEARSRGGQTVEMGGAQIPRALAPQVAEAMIVGQNYDEVRRALWGLCREHSRGGHPQEFASAQNIDGHCRL